MSKALESNKNEQLFHRYAGNPILSPGIWPYPANAVINPAAVRMNNETLLLARVEDTAGVSHFTIARSRDGFTNWLIESEPTFKADSYDDVEKWGVEDARIVWLEEQKQFAITYISYEPKGHVVCLAITKNFRTFARLGLMLPPENRGACLFPRRFKGRFALIHQPLVLGRTNILISFSPDLKHWGDERTLIITRPELWDCHKVGLACQPVELPQGWLMFYYGVQMTRGIPVYRIGVALLDIEEPWRVLRRSRGWILEPQEPFECVGDVGGVVFPTGAAFNDLTNELNLYYGTANRSIAVATASLNRIVDYVKSCPTTE